MLPHFLCREPSPRHSTRELLLMPRRLPVSCLLPVDYSLISVTLSTALSRQLPEFVFGSTSPWQMLSMKRRSRDPSRMFSRLLLASSTPPNIKLQIARKPFPEATFQPWTLAARGSSQRSWCISLRKAVNVLVSRAHIGIAR